MLFRPRNIFAEWRAVGVTAGTVSACRVSWGLEVSLAAEKCALVKAQIATKEIA